jgi:hypothetical protein
MFIKEYYIQLPFILMRFIFAVAHEDDLIVARYMGSVLNKLKRRSGLEVVENSHSEHD